jgi:hypothetical protein
MSSKPTVHVYEKDGKRAEFTFRELNSLDRQYVQSAQAKAFRKAFDEGYPLRAKVDKMLEEQGLIDRTSDVDKIDDLRSTLKTDEIALRSAKNTDGSKMTKLQGRALALKMKETRGKISAIADKFNSYYTNTAENIAFMAQLEASLYCSTQLPDGTAYWKTEDEMRNDFFAMSEINRQYFKFISDLDIDNMDSKDYEVTWLKKYKFVDDKGRFINEKGQLTNVDGKLVDEEGRYIDSNGEYVDVDGNRVDKDGQLVVEDGWGDVSAVSSSTDDESSPSTFKN